MMQRRMARGAFSIAVAMALTAILPGCTRSTPVWRDRGGPPRVVVTIPPLDNFVRSVGGKHVGVVCLCTTQGPHHYQFNAEDAMLLREADLFFAIGLTLDDKFADPLQRGSHNPHLQYVNIGEVLHTRDEGKPAKEKLLLANEATHDEHEDEPGHAHPHDHGAYDPHIWLGIPQAIAMVEIIRDRLKKVDPQNEADYDKNAEKYIETLTRLHTYGKEKLKDKKNRKIIAFHESLRYFAKSFDVDIVDVIELTPGAEAGQGHVAQLAKKCLENDIRVIAVEPQYPQETAAEKLRKAVTEKDNNKDITRVEIDPLETVDKNDLKKDEKELNSPDWYAQRMRRNLDNLAKALP